MPGDPPFEHRRQDDPRNDWIYNTVVNLHTEVGKLTVLLQKFIEESGSYRNKSRTSMHGINNNLAKLNAEFNILTRQRRLKEKRKASLKKFLKSGTTWLVTILGTAVTAWLTAGLDNLSKFFTYLKGN